MTMTNCKAQRAREQGYHHTSGRESGFNSSRNNRLNRPTRVVRHIADDRPSTGVARGQELPSKVGGFWGLSGNNGSWTNSDDVKVKGQKPKAQANKPLDGQGFQKKMSKMLRAAIIDAAGITSRAVATKGGVGHYGDKIEREVKRLADNGLKYIGWGSYKMAAGAKHNFGDVRSNGLIKGKVNPNANFGASGVTVVHEETVMKVRSNVLTGGVFNMNQVIFQPGDQNVLPFVATIAQNYSQYCVEGLIFSFKPSMTSYTTTGAMGTITLAWSSNVNDVAPGSQEAIEMFEGALMARMDENLAYGVECAPGSNAQNCYYVRTGSIAATSNPQAYDFGRLFVAIDPSSAIPADSILGTIRASYVLRFKGGRASTTVNGWARFSRSGVSNSTPLGTATTDVKTIGCLSDAVITSTRISLPTAREGDLFQVVWTVSGTAATIATPARTPQGMEVYATAYNGAAGSEAASPVDGQSTTRWTYTGTWRVSEDENVVPWITFGTAGTLPGSATCTLTITAIGRGLPVGSL